MHHLIVRRRPPDPSGSERSPADGPAVRRTGEAEGLPIRPVRRPAAWAGRGAAVVAAAALVGVVTAGVAAAGPAPDQFSQTNLVANTAALHPKLVDPNLTNAWGLASTATSPIWVSDNNSGDATAYSGGVAGGSVALDITVPVPGGNPTGQVANTDSSAFPVGGSSGQPAIFIVDTDSIGATQSPGEIAAWSGGSSFVVEDSPTGGPGGTTPTGAVFKGLAILPDTPDGPELFATDVANATVDVFNQDFAPVSTPTAFRDPHIPAGYTPFGIQAVGDDLYVTYARQNKAHTNVVPGLGKGYVDEYSAAGQLLHRVVSAGAASPLDEPWGIAVAPAGFGPFAGQLLVGNLGNGWINVFSPKKGTFLGTLDGTTGSPIAIDGLWALEPGTAAFGGTGTVVFSAGPSGYGDGLVGTLSPS